MSSSGLVRGGAAGGVIASSVRGATDTGRIA